MTDYDFNPDKIHEYKGRIARYLEQAKKNEEKRLFTQNWAPFSELIAAAPKAPLFMLRE